MDVELKKNDKKQITKFKRPKDVKTPPKGQIELGEKSSIFWGKWSVIENVDIKWIIVQNIQIAIVY